MCQRRAVIDLPARAEAVGEARAAVRAVMALWQVSGLSGVAEVIASELFANALKHAPGSDRLELCLELRPTGVCIALADESPERPVIHDLSADRPSGRGMRIVDALSVRWGTRDYRGGKQVWVDLGLPDGTIDG